MYLLRKEEMAKITPLFDGWNETLIWSCLQGYMGNAWVDDRQGPKSAQIVTGDFCFFAGIPDAELVKNIPEFFPSPCILMIPQNPEWANLIEQEYNGNCKKFMRYAIRKEWDIFNVKMLQTYAEKLPIGYYIKAIDEKLYHRLSKERWSQDFCSQFPTYRAFETSGLGFVALKDGEPVSGASSYTVYDKGIEIELDTKQEYRRKGLAIACAARLILECLNRHLYPSWDAANQGSLALAQKLGYHFEKEYVTYAVKVSNNTVTNLAE